MLHRRTLLTGIAAVICAPAIVRASSLMPIKSAKDTVGSYYVWHDQSGNGRHLIGNWNAEIIVYDKAHDAETRAKVMAYLEGARRDSGGIAAHYLAPPGRPLLLGANTFTNVPPATFTLGTLLN